MTHSLHRKKDAEGLCDDYVMLIMAEPGKINQESVKNRMRESWDIISHYEAELTNFGTVRGGGRHKKPIEAFKEKNGFLIHAVFKDRDSLKACLNELKDRDLGVSVSVSGCLEGVNETCAEVGLNPHTMQYALGIHGKTDKLPDEKVLNIATICGHAMVSTNLIAHVIEKISKKRMTHAEAAEKLCGMCDCGIFNPHKAERLLRQMV